MHMKLCSCVSQLLVTSMHMLFPSQVTLSQVIFPSPYNSFAHALLTRYILPLQKSLAAQKYICIHVYNHIRAYAHAYTLKRNTKPYLAFSAGKYIDLHFGGNGALLGGSIQTYLLEKVSVCIFCRSH
jgi:hypothetical protein